MGKDFSIFKWQIKLYVIQRERYMIHLDSSNIFQANAKQLYPWDYEQYAGIRFLNVATKWIWFVLNNKKEKEDQGCWETENSKMKLQTTKPTSKAMGQNRLLVII